MVLTAGLGKRMEPFSKRVPKPLLPFLGVPILQLHLDQFQKKKFSHLYCNLYWKKDAFYQAFSQLETGSLIIKSCEEKTLLETAGGIRGLLRFVRGDTFFVSNSDMLWDLDVDAFLERHLFYKKKHQALGTLLLRNDPEGLYGSVRWDPKTHQVLSISSIARKGCHFAGCAFYEKKGFLSLEEGRVARLKEEIWDPWIQAGKLFVYVPEEDFFWMDLGQVRSWWDAHFKGMDLLERGTLPEGYWRLKKENCFLSQGICVLKREKGFLEKKNLRLWTAPIYWGGDMSAGSERKVGGIPLGVRTTHPQKVGSFSVLYGVVPNREHFTHGIGNEQVWVGFES